MIIKDFLQGSPEWFAGRCGKHRASKTDALCARTKNNVRGAAYNNYRAELICEQLTGQIAQTFQSDAMLRGIELEDKARKAAALVLGVQIRQVGLLVHEVNANFVASPDGVIEEEKALLEIKCPNTATIVDLHLSNEIEKRYILQMQAQLACAKEYTHSYFVAFDDRLPPDLQLYIKKIDRDNKLIAEIEHEASELLDDVADAVAKLKAKAVKEAA